MQTRNRLFFILALLSLIVLLGCTPKDEQTYDAMAVINKTKQVRISTDPPRLPFEYGLDTSVQGFDIDIGNEIAEDIGAKGHWAKIDGYNALFEKLRKGETEIVISTVTPNPQLEEEFAFSQPYYASRDGIARRRSDEAIKDLASLSGKSVGVSEGRPGDLFMAKQQTASDVTIVKFHYLDEALAALNLSEIDAVVGDAPVMAYSGYKSFRNLVILPTDMNTYSYNVAVRKNDQVLLESINKTLDRLKESGELAALEEKWFQDVLVKAEEDRLKLEEEEKLKKAPKRINVRINKKSGSFNMDRLDGYVLVLEGASGKYQSTAILTEGNRGNCRFTKPIPPGKYTLNMSIFKTTTSVEIHKVPKSTLTMVIDYLSDSAGIRIEVK